MGPCVILSSKTDFCGCTLYVLYVDRQERWPPWWSQTRVITLYRDGLDKLCEGAVYGTVVGIVVAAVVIAIVIVIVVVMAIAFVPVRGVSWVRRLHVRPSRRCAHPTQFLQVHWPQVECCWLHSTSLHF